MLNTHEKKVQSVCLRVVCFPGSSPVYFYSRPCWGVTAYDITILLYGFFPYDGYYSETDRTGAVQKTIYYCQRPPPQLHDVLIPA